MTPLVEVRSLRKRFRVQAGGVASLKTMLLWWKRRRIREFEALKGVSFDVQPGECVAVVGRNGAGKSTLLSLLAKIYRPTSGSFRLRGRIAPLLELGAGFHPDLTGVENVFFNGVVLGLTRRQVRERLDEILQFSELGEAIHAPVRTYSSGMTARLGFAIAIHADADILLVDEVLSVGDFDFEQKCLRRVAEIRERGGCILLVSHNLATVEGFADRCVWLQDGAVVGEGTPQEVLPRYLAAGGR